MRSREMAGMVAAAALVFAAVALVSPVTGQDAPDAKVEMGTLRVSFQDSETGKAIVPESVLINGRDYARDVDRSGRLSVQCPNGQLEMQVKAKEYVPFVTLVTVSGDSTLVNTISLDPTNPRPADESAVAPDVAVAGGFIVDDATGALLPNVAIEVPVKGVTAQSDSEGSFTLRIPLPGATLDNPRSERVTMILSKEGYVSEERKRVEVLSGQKKVYTLRLEPVEIAGDTARKVVDEMPDTGRVSSWVFEVDLE